MNDDSSCVYAGLVNVTLTAEIYVDADFETVT